MNYNPKDVSSIINYAKQLVGNSLRDVCGDAVKEQRYKGKGNFGQLLEKFYFQYEPNSTSAADFGEVGMELKSTPLKVLSNSSLRSKERLVLNIINYFEVINQKFETSSFYRKNSHLLLIFYLHQYDIDVLDLVIKIVGEWKFPETDLEIIRADWELITNKIKQGKAHELSEGDTFYLGAATKGGKGGNLRGQPNNDIPAKQRAYTFKQGYLNHIIATLSNDQSISYGKLISSTSQIKNKTIQEIVSNRFKPFLNKSIDDIINKLDNTNLNKSSKNFYSNLTKQVLGISLDKEIEEFEKAEIKVKTIRLKSNNLPKEDMSFPSFDYCEILDEDWENSKFREILETKYFFVFFKYDEQDVLKLHKVKFWNMSQSDIIEAKKVWQKVRQVVSNGDIVYEVVNGIRHTNFPNKSFNKIAHVRPHAKNSADVLPLPVKDKITKKMEYTKHCFWLNNSYIRDIILPD
jgi:DNA mismatch repair protein MutH